MFEVVLWQPESPPNTGSLMRLTVNTGCRLHLIEPLGFALDDTRMRRAGLDYREYADVVLHPSFEAFVERIDPPRIYLYTQYAYTVDTDVALSGSKTTSCPPFCSTNQRGLATGSSRILVGCEKLSAGYASITLTLVLNCGRAGAIQG